MTQAEARAFLLALLPPGLDRWVDISPGPDPNDPATGASDPWLLLDAAAAGLLEAGFEPLETVAADGDPQTLTATGIAAWEVATGLDRSKLALSGTLEQRLAQVWARLAEWGIPNDANILSALAPIVGAASILRVDRDDLTEANTHAFGSGAINASSTFSSAITLGDNAPASSAGAQVRVNLTHSDVEDLSITITPPSGSPVTLAATGSLGSGSVTDRQWKFWVLSLADAVISGTWTLQVINGGSGTGTVNVDTDKFTDVFVEGIGRSSGGAEGLGSSIFEFAVLVDPNAAPAGFDLGAARETLARFTCAWERSFLVQKMSGGGSCGIWDDPNAVWDGFVWC